MAFVFSMLFFLLPGFATVFIRILRGEAKEVVNFKTTVINELILFRLGVADKANAALPGTMPGELRPLLNGRIEAQQNMEPEG